MVREPVIHGSEDEPPVSGGAGGIGPGSGAEEQRFDDELRPKRLEDVVGQREVIERLRITLNAARKRGEPLGHLLLDGPPGLGKTTFATVIPRELGTEIQITSGPVLSAPKDLLPYLTNATYGSVLFIDEIHRLPAAVEEFIYPAMEDFQLDIVLGKGPAARSIRLDLPNFCLVGATTRTGLITGPLRDRFGLVARLDYYEPHDLQAIVQRAAAILEVEIDSEGAVEIARRSRGTPRIANRLLRRVRDVAEVEGDGRINAVAAQQGLEIFGIDSLGLDKLDRSILSALCQRFGGGPIGLSTLAIAVSEPTETVEDVYEPFLIQQGLMLRTPRGRMATTAAWRHLGLVPPAATQEGTDLSLFE